MTTKLVVVVVVVVKYQYCSCDDMYEFRVE